MPGSKGKGRPKTKVFMKIGTISITRPDSFNWAVKIANVDHTTYHTTLPQAIKRAVQLAAETKSKDAQEWLAEYAQVTATLETKLARALQTFTEEGA